MIFTEKTEKFVILFAQCVAMISVLAEHRILANEIFRNMPMDKRKEFTENAMIVLKYLEDAEE